MMTSPRAGERRRASAVCALWRFAILAACLLGAGCSSPRFIDDRAPSWAGDLEAREQDATDLPEGGTASTAGAPDTAEMPRRRKAEAFYRPGTGRLVGPRGAPIADVAVVEDGQIKLNFQNADLLQVVKVILGDMLAATYAVDPAVQGEVTMQTSQPLSRADLVPTLELLLRMNDAAIVMDGHIYRIVPIAKAATGVRAPQLGDADIPLPRGYGVRIVPLRHVSADEMAKILEPFIADGKNLVRTDSKRNVVILAGDGDDMGRLLEAIRMFDVDRMKGMSVAMFTPDFVDAKTLGAELEALLANPDNGLMAGLVRFLVIERLNAVMVVTPRADYLAQVRGWVQRLDADSGEGGARLFVYRVQNGKAVSLAEALNLAFGLSTLGRPGAGQQLAPGLEPTTLQSAAPGGERPAEAVAGLLGQTGLTAGAMAGLGAGPTGEARSRVRVIPDEPNNSLLIMATNQEYQQILAALKQMDVVPLQVLVDVTIAEVTLTDDLRYGVEWYLNNRVNTKNFDGYGISMLDLGAQGIAPQVPGFSYALQGLGGDVRFVLNMLAEDSNLSVLSSPSLLVLNNQEAKIQVGDEVPITTQQQQATTGGGIANPNIINSIQYRETGVLLTVKPRVNISGLVTMDVRQEVSRVPTLNNTNELTPRIQTRKINSTVAVQSGDTIILGGLIRDNRDRTESGVPFLHKIPILGAAFGKKGDSQQRTELLMLITPRAILDRTAALQVTEEFRRKVNSLIPIDSNKVRASKPAVTPVPREALESNPSPQAATCTIAPSSPTIDQGGSVSWSATYTGFRRTPSFSWTFSGGSPGTSTSRTGTVSDANAGTFTTSLRVSRGGTSATCSTSVTVQKLRLDAPEVSINSTSRSSHDVGTDPYAAGPVDEAPSPKNANSLSPVAGTGTTGYQVLAMVDTVLPISGEASCKNCQGAPTDVPDSPHKGAANAALTKAGLPVADSTDVPLGVSVEYATDINILRLNDELHGAEYRDSAGNATACSGMTGSNPNRNANCLSNKALVQKKGVV